MISKFNYLIIHIFSVLAVHQAARETIALAEERFLSNDTEERQFDSAWQEMLNHATIKVCHIFPFYV